MEMTAHIDPELFIRWVGPDGMNTTIIDWDATTGGRWRYVSERDGEEFGSTAAFTRSATTASSKRLPSTVNPMVYRSRRCAKLDALLTEI